VLWGLGTVLLLAILGWGDRDRAISAGPDLFLLLCMPVIALVNRFSRKRGTVVPGVLLPADRTAYLKQRGLAVALNHLQLWVAINAGAILLWIAAPARPLPAVLVANLLVISGLAQVLLFGVMVWLERFHLSGVTVLVGLWIVLAMAVAQFRPSPTEWQFQAWTIMAAFAVFGVLLARDAYRRWLVADIG
jgi:hypothetical protein